MMTEKCVARAHDVLTAVIEADVLKDLPEDQAALFHHMRGVLCWVLGHQSSGEAFGELVLAIERELQAAGWGFTEVNEAVVGEMDHPITVAPYPR